jgi:hypothetical protein
MSKPKPTAPTNRKPFVYLHLPPDFCPKYSTLDEACSYARHGRWQGHYKIKTGRWKSFKDGRRRVIVFASVVEDEERLKAKNLGQHVEPVVVKRPVGRPRKVKPEAAAVSAE